MADIEAQEAFLIREVDGKTIMKNISPSTLQHFHGLTLEYLDTFMFEFYVFCRTYEYELFPSTLKDAALGWFMDLPRNNITT